MFGSPVKREPGLRNDQCFILKCFATFEPLKKSDQAEFLSFWALRGSMVNFLTRSRSAALTGHRNP